MILDNFDLILPFIQTRESGNVHLIQMLNRQKGIDTGRTSFYDVVYREKLEGNKDFYKRLMGSYDRMYININYLSLKRLNIEYMKLCLNNIDNQVWHTPNRQIKSVMGSHKDSKYILVDIDNMDNYETVKNIVGDNLVLDLPSVKGRHLIAKGFDVRPIYTAGESVHKNNPTILFAKGEK